MRLCAIGLGLWIGAALLAPAAEACQGFGPAACSAGAALPGASAADGQGCPTRFDPYAGAEYDDAKHDAWHKRFWTGRCDGLGFFDFCVSDEGGWPLLIERTLPRAPAGERAALRAEMWGLGRLIGHEWARANDVRHISTDDLQRWQGVLESAADPWDGVAAICAEATEKMAR